MTRVSTVMTETQDMDKSAGVCNDCGGIFVIATSDAGDFMMGVPDCPSCGSDDFAPMEYRGSWD